MMSLYIFALSVLLSASPVRQVAGVPSQSPDVPAAQDGQEQELGPDNSVHKILPDFAEITPTLYRGAQASHEGFRKLAAMGVKIVIDLRGDRSFIRRIEMIYRSRPGFRGEAVIRVFGEPSRRGPPGPPPMPGPRDDWVELGCQQVSLFGKDRDTVRVGRREGRFKAIRLHARGADVVTVIYGNGEPDDLPTRHFLRQGGYTPPMDLKGWQRPIDRVDMVYKTVPNFKGLATVCVEGLQ